MIISKLEGDHDSRHNAVTKNTERTVPITTVSGNPRKMHYFICSRPHGSVRRLLYYTIRVIF